MTVNVLDGAATRPCPSCGSVMALADEDGAVTEAEIEEEDFSPRFVAVETSDDRPMRPTVVLGASEPPKFKPTRSAGAWLTVGHGLTLLQRGVLIALIQPVAIGLLLLLGRINVMAFVPASETDGISATAWLAFVLTVVPLAIASVLFVLGRLCVCRVPPRTEARGLLLAACGGTGLTALFALAGSGAWLCAPDTKLFYVLSTTLVIAGISGLATEIVFLIGLGRVGRFVRRPAVGVIALVFIVSLAVAVVTIAIVSDRTAGLGLLLLAETLAAALLVLYLVVLGQARGSVLTKTADE